jgi:integrase
MSADPIRRGDTYYLRRRVPRRFKVAEERTLIWVSLKTDSLRDARSRADRVWSQLIEAWEARLAGNAEAAEAQMTAARRIAQSHGLRYRPEDEVAKGTLEDLVARIEAAGKRDNRLATARNRVALGSAAPERFTVSRALQVFFEVSEDRSSAMTRNQKRVWENHRKLSIRMMIDAIGDIDIDQIGPDEILDFREALWSFVKADQMQRATANKRMGQALAVLQHVSKVRRLGLTFPTEGMRFTDAEQNTRLPFSDEWIRTKILAPGAMDGLNLEARCILLGMINTGYRPSEGAELRAEDIRLDTDVPHISIHGRHRKLKTRHSERMIPLTGISLEAFRACPGGFPRYQDSASLTAVVNRYLRENGLRETEKHSFYGLRHSFEDRMLQHDVDERIRRDLMGHKLEGRERYGAGARLEKLHEILLPMAL